MVCTTWVKACSFSCIARCCGGTRARLCSGIDYSTAHVYCAPLRLYAYPALPREVARRPSASAPPPQDAERVRRPRKGPRVRALLYNHLCTTAQAARALSALGARVLHTKGTLTVRHPRAIRTFSAPLATLRVAPLGGEGIFATSIALLAFFRAPLVRRGETSTGCKGNSRRFSLPPSLSRTSSSLSFLRKVLSSVTVQRTVVAFFQISFPLPPFSRIEARGIRPRLKSIYGQANASHTFSFVCASFQVPIPLVSMPSILSVPTLALLLLIPPLHAVLIGQGTLPECDPCKNNSQCLSTICWQGKCILSTDSSKDLCFPTTVLAECSPCTAKSKCMGGECLSGRCVLPTKFSRIKCFRPKDKKEECAQCKQENECSGKRCWHGKCVTKGKKDKNVCFPMARKLPMCSSCETDVQCKSSVCDEGMCATAAGGKDSECSGMESKLAVCSSCVEDKECRSGVCKDKVCVNEKWPDQTSCKQVSSVSVGDGSCASCESSTDCEKGKCWKGKCMVDMSLASRKRCFSMSQLKVEECAKCQQHMECGTGFCWGGKCVVKSNSESMKKCFSRMGEERGECKPCRSSSSCKSGSCWRGMCVHFNRTSIRKCMRMWWGRRGRRRRSFHSFPRHSFPRRSFPRHSFPRHSFPRY